MKALATIGRTVTIYKDRLIYPLGACITIFDNGEWLAGFNHSRHREKIMHPPNDPLYRNLLTQSLDQGATWKRKGPISSLPSGGDDLTWTMGTSVSWARVTKSDTYPLDIKWPR